MREWKKQEKENKCWPATVGFMQFPSTGPRAVCYSTTGCGRSARRPIAPRLMCPSVQDTTNHAKRAGSVGAVVRGAAYYPHVGASPQMAQREKATPARRAKNTGEGMAVEWLASGSGICACERYFLEGDASDVFATTRLCSLLCCSLQPHFPVLRSYRTTYVVR